MQGTAFRHLATKVGKKFEPGSRLGLQVVDQLRWCDLTSFLGVPEASDRDAASRRIALLRSAGSERRIAPHIHVRIATKAEKKF